LYEKATVGMRSNVADGNSSCDEGCAKQHQQFKRLFLCVQINGYRARKGYQFMAKERYQLMAKKRYDTALLTAQYYLTTVFSE
jgi:hypothetical protein